MGRLDWQKEASKALKRIEPSDKVAVHGAEPGDEQPEADVERDAGPRRSPTLADLPSGLVRRRMIMAALSAGIVVIGIIVLGTSPKTHSCFPLPTIANSTNVCNGFASMPAGGHCRVECALDLAATGRLQCNAEGLFVYPIPACV